MRNAGGVQLLPHVLDQCAQKCLRNDATLVAARRLQAKHQLERLHVAQEAEEVEGVCAAGEASHVVSFEWRAKPRIGNMNDDRETNRR